MDKRFNTDQQFAATHKPFREISTLIVFQSSPVPMVSLNRFYLLSFYRLWQFVFEWRDMLSHACKSYRHI